MRSKIFLHFLFLFCFYSLYSQDRELVWEEDFNGEDLDMASWNFETGDGCPHLCGWGNNERQIYTKKNHQVRDGLLFISARKDGETYTSAKITTKGKKEFTYGKIEVRAKLPLGVGLWPAFWMLGANIDQVGWPDCGEIDILEYVGKEPEYIFTSLHTRDSHGITVNTRKDIVKGIEEGFHTYAINWTEEGIEFLIDGNSFYTFSPVSKGPEIWPFDKPFYIILNLAVGGNFGGPEVDDSIFPQEFIIDYIKVYQ
ncbi:MAG: glycoside hydrolase family 16 protein [Flavobacteriaceae bacterium]|nr:MAG: glycoside hydrolase family 16 protein [Flavobacteriaceae bacterium]